MNLYDRVVKLLEELRMEPEELSAALQALIDEHRYPNNRYPGPPRHVSELKNLYDLLNNSKTHETAYISTGLPTLDYNIGGFRKGEVYRISTPVPRGWHLASGMLVTSAMRISRTSRVLYFNYQFPEAEMGNLVDSVMNNFYDEHSIREVEHQFYVYTRRHLRISAITDQIEREHRAHGTEIIYLDGPEWIFNAYGPSIRKHLIDQLYHELKCVAEELKLVIVLKSALIGESDDFFSNAIDTEIKLTHPGHYTVPENDDIVEMVIFNSNGIYQMLERDYFVIRSGVVIDLPLAIRQRYLVGIWCDENGESRNDDECPF